MPNATVFWKNVWDGRLELLQISPVSGLWYIPPSSLPDKIAISLPNLSHETQREVSKYTVPELCLLGIWGNIWDSKSYLFIKVACFPVKTNLIKHSPQRLLKIVFFKSFRCRRENQLRDFDDLKETVLHERPRLSPFPIDFLLVFVF